MLLDTSGLFCMFHLAEPRSADAQTLFEAAPRKLTHGYVLAEFVALVLARGLPRRQALEFHDALLAHPDVETVWVTEALHVAGVRLLEARLDKTYTLCDAVSLVLMHERGVTEALTTDRHFEQEGFRRLLA